MKLRSQTWFGRRDKNGFMYRTWMKSQGWSHDLFDGRPVVAICNTWSELTPCNGRLRELAECVKRGMWESTLAARRAQWTPPPLPERGWLRLYLEHVLQADKGADLDFLVGHSGAPVGRDSH
jgi:dihydroxyacid dehydratase/phosphogluconate dehydratase